MMIHELMYAVGEMVLYVPDDSQSESDVIEGIVIENALPTAPAIEVILDGEEEPRSIPTHLLVRQASRLQDD